MFLFILILVGIVYTEEVVNLPKLNFKVYSRHYSGYLNVSDTHRLHYWFIESQNTPSVDPLIFWFNGGPGCSSLFGMFNENGPFLFSKGNDTFRRNEYTWNRMANIVYLESPAGVGFSYSTDGEVRTDDDLTADENYVAVKEFLKEFPQFRNHDIFLAGESYAGIYIPMLAERMIDGQNDFSINLKGMAIGNGCVNFNNRRNTSLLMSQSHGLIDKKTYNIIIDRCCFGNRSNCKMDMDYEYCYHVDKYTIFQLYDIDPYDLSRKCNNDIFNKKSVIPNCRHDKSIITKYFQNAKVREAIHIPTEIHDWQMCNGREYMKIKQDTSAQVKKAVEHGVRTLLYYGDQDLACDFIMGQQFAAKLKIPKIESKAPWVYNGVVAGYKTVYEGLTFLTIRGAGHLVPMSHPQQTFHVLQQFLNDEPI